MKTLLLAQFALLLGAVQAPILLPGPIRVQGQIPQTGEGVINGLVKKLNSEDPIKDVQITLTGGPATSVADTAGQLQTTTDSDGRFVFLNLQPGRYTIGIHRDGYFHRYLPNSSEASLPPGQRAGGTVVVDPGGSTLTVVYALIQAGTISGRILEPAGRPAVAASVWAARVRYENGLPRLGSQMQTSTDDRGEYRLYGLEPGEYFVLAEKDLPTGRAKGYFPGGDDARSAVRIRVGEGRESAKTDFSLASAPATVSISGVVTNLVPGFQTPGLPPIPPGIPPEARAVLDVQRYQTSLAQQYYLMHIDDGRLYDGFVTLPNALTSEEDRAAGKFELRNVRSGSYELYAVFQDRSVSPARSYLGHQTVDVGVQDVMGIAMQIKPGIDLKGTVRVDGRISPNPVRVQLLPKVDLPGWRELTVVSTDGTFAIPNLPETQYRISIEPSEPNSFLAELFQGRNSIVDRGIVAVARGLPETLEASIKTPAATIRGTVSASQEQLAEGLMVTLVPDEDRRENFALYKRVIAKTGGAFSFDGVAPGTYKLFAWEALPDGAEQNEEFVAPYKDRGTEVVSSAGKTSTAVVRLISK